MSYDRQLDQICQHQVANEAVYVAADRLTVKPLRAIAAGGQVQVYLNGEVLIPPSGVSMAPSVLGTKAGPFRIQAGQNDRVQLRLNQEAVIREVVLPSSASMTTDQLVRLLNDARLGVVWSNVAGKVQLQGTSTGTQASVYVLEGSTLAPTLGLTAAREYRGKDLFPGWSLITAPRVLTDRPLKYIVFDRPLRAFGDFVQLTYTTVQQDCRRCGGLGIENDWRYTKNGNVIEVRDEALLIQEMLKLFFTDEGSNPFHSWYGTRLVDQIGQKVGIGSLVQNLIVSDIYRAFGRWQSIKRQQEVAIGQMVSDEEYPFRLLGVNVERSQQDPTVFFVSVTVQNRSTRPIVIDRGIRIPEPQDLLGSTQQAGVFRQSLQNYVLTG
jgi:hypothetical protein